MHVKMFCYQKPVKCACSLSPPPPQGPLVLLGAAQAQECPTDVPVVLCFVDPCLTATCPNVPTATCRADYCGDCNARWFVNSGTVEVTRNCTTTGT